jgi:hypothetical protein
MDDEYRLNDPHLPKALWRGLEDLRNNRTVPLDTALNEEYKPIKRRKIFLLKKSKVRPHDKTRQLKKRNVK